MCAYIKCTYKSLLASFFSAAFTQKIPIVEFGSENNFFSPTSSFFDWYLCQQKKKKKKNRKNFNFILFSVRKKKAKNKKNRIGIESYRIEILERRGRNEANAFDKQRNTLGVYGRARNKVVSQLKCHFQLSLSSSSHCHGFEIERSYSTSSPSCSKQKP